MKKLLLILLCLPILTLAQQQTSVPDANFEQALINLGYDNVLDDSVTTANINIITYLNVYSDSIADLTGIEDFTALTQLYCGDNQLTSLDLSNNTALIEINCSENQLSSLDLRNGNNINFQYFLAYNNPNLYCIDVDNVVWSTANWIYIDSWTSFGTNCSATSVQEHTTNNNLLKITDLLGRETKGTKNEVLFYIYDDGIVEKRIVIE